MVTGAARGIGAAIAERFVAEGASVVLVDVNNAEEQAKRLRRSGGRALALVANVLEQSSIDAMVSHASESFGGVDIPVNNAGFTRDMRIGRMTEPDWDAVVDVILKGSFLCTKAVSGLTTERGWGRIVNISSRAHLGNPGQANYSAAKAGLLGLTRALALELGRFGVTVNAVAPGIVDTEAVRALAHFDKIRGAAEKATPISRLGNVYDIADAVASWLRRGLATSREKYFM